LPRPFLLARRLSLARRPASADYCPRSGPALFRHPVPPMPLPAFFDPAPPSCADSGEENIV